MTTEVPAEYLAHIAQDEAVLGHHNAALTHLEQAYSMGWRMFLSTGRYMDPADDPTLATLRGNPRFERINRLVKAQGRGTDRVSCLHEPAFMTRKLEDPEKLISWRLPYLMSVFGRKQALR